MFLILRSVNYTFNETLTVMSQKTKRRSKIIAIVFALVTFVALTLKVDPISLFANRDSATPTVQTVQAQTASTPCVIGDHSTPCSGTCPSGCETRGRIGPWKNSIFDCGEIIPCCCVVV